MKTTHKTKFTLIDSLMRYAEILGYGDLHTKFDKQTGLTAIIAVHNLKRGPAIGGCRMISYQTRDKALEDVIRLGYMMSYKAAINNLAHGGGKAVIIRPTKPFDRKALLEKFGDFVQELGGRYITAIDSGTSCADMDIIETRTSFVTCTSRLGGASDPSPLTAYGVKRGIEAAVKFKLGASSVEGVHIAIQGAGHVGYHLAKDLVVAGAKVTMTDIDNQALERCVKEFGVTPCAPDEIFDIPADVFSPCALGAVINLNTIARLKVPAVAGAANNQLSHSQYGSLLHEKGILYAPDFLINAGGLIHVAVIYEHASVEKSLQQIKNIYDRAIEIFEKSMQENIATNLIAERIARERLGLVY